MRFDWDNTKDAINQTKHGVRFVEAQYAFQDKHRIIHEDLAHSTDDEKRYYKTSA